MNQNVVRAYEGKAPYIFVSYAHKDTAQVLPVIAQLQSFGYRVWYDEGIAPGSEWPENIAMHLNNCAAVIAFLSPNSVNSSNCRREITYALSKNKPFLGIFLTETAMSPGMEMQISSQQCVMKYAYRDLSLFYEKVCSFGGLYPCKIAQQTQSSYAQPNPTQSYYTQPNATQVRYAPPVSVQSAAPVGQGMPLRAEGAQDPQAQRKRRRTIELTCVIAAAVFVLAILGILIGQGLAGGQNEEASRIFQGPGYKITLTDSFQSTTLEGYDAAYETTDVAILVLSERFTDVPEISSYTSYEYADYILRANGKQCEVKSYKDFLYFEYVSTSQVSGEDMHYFVTIHKGEDAYWLVQLVTAEKNYSKYRESFLKWADTFDSD